MICRTLNLSEIVKYQTVHGWLISPIWIKGISLFSLSINFQEIIQSIDILKIILWIPLFISFVVFTISMFAETNRLPFDLPEAETELVGGYHTEYSSMKFALFFLGEYAAMIIGSAVIVTLFFGAWHVPLLPTTIANPYSIWGVILGTDSHRGLLHQSSSSALLLYLGSLDIAALSVRSIDEAWLVFLHRDRSGECIHCRSHFAFHAKIRS